MGKKRLGRRIVAFVLCVVLSMSAVSVHTFAAEGVYLDTTIHWCREPIRFWTERGVVKGVGAGLFCPDDAITRQAAAVVICRFLGLEQEPVTEAPFPDVPADSPYAPTIAACSSAGLIIGDENGLYRPEDSVTRNAAMVLLARTFRLQSCSDLSALSVFEDVDTAAGWSEGYVAALVEAGIVKGWSGRLRGTDICTRAEFAEMLRLFVSEYYNGSGVCDLSQVQGDGYIALAAGGITLTGSTDLPLLLLPGASNGTIAINGSTIGGGVEVWSKDTELLNVKPNTTIRTGSDAGTTLVNGVQVSPDTVYIVPQPAAKRVAVVETKGFSITVEDGGDAKSETVEIRVPHNAVDEDVTAVLSVEQTSNTDKSLTYEISLKDAKGETVTLLQPATVIIDVGTNRDILSVYHHDAPLTKQVSADALTDQGYYYDAIEGKLYICTASFSPFRIELADREFAGDGELVDGELAGEELAEKEEIAAIYLSDISYVAEQTRIGWGTIAFDQTSNGSPLSLIVEGQTVSFRKGVFAHAESTVVYDLSAYDCDYFSTYYGISSLQGKKGDVKFFIYTSTDGESWQLVSSENPTALTAASEAGFIKVNIKGVKYLKLYADQNGGNGNDHAIYCDAKIYKEGYADNTMPTVAEYDEQIKVAYKGEITADVELLLLQRELVKNAGRYTLKSFADESDANQNMLNMLMNDRELLRLYLMGGKPAGTYSNKTGSYLKSLEVLSKLYTAHGEDWNIDTTTQYGTRLGDLYRTMMLALSLTHSGSVYLWADGSAASDPVERYEIYKELHSAGLIEVATFESLTVEEMRWVMNTIIDDEEIKWLNNYVRNVKGGATGPYSYIRYTFGYNYTLEKYYSAENYDMWNEKYGLSTWGVPYEKGHPKLWIVFEEGSVCGGLSKTGSCIWGAYKGLPNTCVSQPRHCAYIYYTQKNGNGVWELGNNVSGWAMSGKTEHLGIRVMNDWGNSATGYSATYMLLAQAAQNEYDKYEQSEIILMLADVYKSDAASQEALYRKALAVESINFDAWTGLVNLYLNDSSKTEAAYYDLAAEIASALTYYPRPMCDLLSMLEPKLTSSAVQASFAMLKTRTLTAAANATDAQTIQRTAVAAVARQLLGTTDGTIATFSFDGANGGKIVLGSRFDGSDVAWDYSLDGGTTWVQCTKNAHALTQAELDAITVENDIKVHIIGVDYSDANLFTIDIKTSQGIPSTVYANDLEDRVIAATDTMEWRFDETDSWTSFKTAQPDLSGDTTVTVRVGATGVYQTSGTATYTFTADTLPATRKYISIDKLSIADFSSETNPQKDYYKRDWRAVYAIDGNIHTLWHTDPRNIVPERYITIKLSEPLHVSALDYLPSSANSGVGVIKNADIYVSLDGGSWTKAASFTNSPKTYTVKQVTFEPTLAQYVKLVVTKAHYGNDVFANAAMINLYYDSTLDSSTGTQGGNSSEGETAMQGSAIDTSAVTPSEGAAVKSESAEGEGTAAGSVIAATEAKPTE